jgi:hypothetical protein
MKINFNTQIDDTTAKKLNEYLALAKAQSPKVSKASVTDAALNEYMENHSLAQANGQKGDNTMQDKYARLLEIAEETGEVPVSSIDNLTETIADLKTLGYIAYLDPSTDYLIVEKDAHLRVYDTCEV